MDKKGIKFLGGLLFFLIIFSLNLVQANSEACKISVTDLNALSNDEVYGKIVSFGEMGNKLQIQGDFDGALFCYNKTYELALSLNDYYYLAFSLEKIGSVYFDKRDFYSAVDYFEKSYTIFSQGGDFIDSTRLLVLLGKSYLGEDNYQLSFYYFDNAYNLSKSINDPYWEGVSLGYLGTYYREIGDYSKAIEYNKLAFEKFLVSSGTTNYYNPSNMKQNAIYQAILISSLSYEINDLAIFNYYFSLAEGLYFNSSLITQPINPIFFRLYLHNIEDNYVSKANSFLDADSFARCAEYFSNASLRYEFILDNFNLDEQKHYFVEGYKWYTSAEKNYCLFQLEGGGYNDLSQDNMGRASQSFREGGFDVLASMVVNAKENNFQKQSLSDLDLSILLNNKRFYNLTPPKKIIVGGTDYINFSYYTPNREIKFNTDVKIQFCCGDKKDLCSSWTNFLNASEGNIFINLNPDGPGKIICEDISIYSSTNPSVPIDFVSKHYGTVLGFSNHLEESYLVWYGDTGKVLPNDNFEPISITVKKPFWSSLKTHIELIVLLGTFIGLLLGVYSKRNWIKDKYFFIFNKIRFFNTRLEE